MIRDVEKRARTARHQDRRDALLRKQRADTLHKWGDRLILGGNELLHAFVADHEVCGRRVFIDQECLCARLQGLHQVRGLRGRTRCVRGEKPVRIRARRQIINKRRNVHARHRAAILRANRHCIRVSNHPLPAVVEDMRIHAPLHRLQ